MNNFNDLKIKLSLSIGYSVAERTDEHSLSDYFQEGEWESLSEAERTKANELTQLYAKELFNKKVVANKAANRIVWLQLKNDELQNRMDATLKLISKWREYEATEFMDDWGDGKEHAQKNCANELEQVLKGATQ